MSPNDRYDAIVVGVGGIGSAAVHRIAKRGHSVLGLERYGIPHTKGSSHGVTRSFSLTKARGPEYVPIARRALDLWRDLEAESGAKLLYDCGHVRGWPSKSGGHRGGFDDAAAALDEHGIPYEVLTGAELGERFPGFDLPEDHHVIHQPDSGYVEAEGAVSTHVRRAFEHGADIRGHERVTGWRSEADGITVTTDKGVYEAGKLVVTAGPWAAEFLDGLKDVLRRERRTLIWQQPREPELYERSRFPAFSLDTDLGYFYGTPMHGIPGIKYGNTPNVRSAIDPERMTREPQPQDEEILRAYGRTYLPHGAGSTLRLATCIVTYSRDEGFVIDTHPENDDVAFAAGLSGSGFHVAPAVGEALAELAFEDATTLDLDPFRLSRFEN